MSKALNIMADSTKLAKKIVKMTNTHEVAQEIGKLVVSKIQIATDTKQPFEMTITEIKEEGSRLVSILQSFDKELINRENNEGYQQSL
jgi:FtsZ-binding cell division protein ZapB